MTMPSKEHNKWSILEIQLASKWWGKTLNSRAGQASLIITIKTIKGLFCSIVRHVRCHPSAATIWWLSYPLCWPATSKAALEVGQLESNVHSVIELFGFSPSFLLWPAAVKLVSLRTKVTLCSAYIHALTRFALIFVDYVWMEDSCANPSVLEQVLR